MKITLTKDEMLAQWRLRAAIDPSRTDCQITAEYDGLDLDALLLARIDQWYDRLLNTAPLQYLCVDTVDEKDIVASALPQDGRQSYLLPGGIVRLVGIRWQSGIETDIFDCRHPEKASPQALKAVKGLLNPYTAPEEHRPLAVLAADGRNLEIWGVPERPMQALTAVTRPQNGTYTMDDSALALMPILEPGTLD